MAIANKKFVRHSVESHRNYKLQGLVSTYGKEYFFYYWVLVELCAEKALQHPVIPRKFKFHKEGIRSELKINYAKFDFHLSRVKEFELIDYEIDGSAVWIVITSLSKYLGKYEKKTDQSSSRTPEQKERAKKGQDHLYYCLPKPLWN